MITKKQIKARIHNWLLFRVAGIRAALASNMYKDESEEIQHQVDKVDKEAKKLQYLLREE